MAATTKMVDILGFKFDFPLTYSIVIILYYPLWIIKFENK